MLAPSSIPRYRAEFCNESAKVFGFASNVIGPSAAAWPPDVRRWLCPAESSWISLGYAPVSDLALEICWTKPHQGLSPKCKSTFPAGLSHRLTSGGKAET